MILLAKTHQARDKIALWSHNDPDTTKHYAFHRPRALNIVKHVFWEVQIGTRRRGRRALGLRENNDLALKSEVLLGFWSLSGKVGGCRPLKN